MSLKLTTQHYDPSPDLHKFNLPDAANKIGVRLYNASVRKVPQPPN